MVNALRRVQGRRGRMRAGVSLPSAWVERALLASVILTEGLASEDRAQSASEVRPGRHWVVGLVDGVLQQLTPEEEQVLRLRFGIGGPTCAADEVGERFGLSVERVRRIESRALSKLRLGAMSSSARV